MILKPKLRQPVTDLRYNQRCSLICNSYSECSLFDTRNSKNSYSLTIMRWNCSRFEISFFSLLTIGKFLNYILNCWNVLKPDFSIRVKRFVKKEHFFWSSFQTNKIRSLKIEKTNQKRVFIPEEATLREVNDKQSCSIIVQRLFGSLSGNLNQTAGRLEWITDTRRPTVLNKKSLLFLTRWKILPLWMQSFIFFNKFRL